MVLSNKKLKQKIREELAKNLCAVAAGPNSKSDTNSQSQSLKELLDSASHKPRLSKREKRRKAHPFVGSNVSNAGIGEKKEVEVVGDAESGQRSEETDENKEKKKKKKRKRDDSGSVELGEEGKGSGDKEGDESHKKKTNEKKKKKKHKKKKRKTDEMPEIAEETIVEDTESQADGVVPRKLYVGGIPYYYTEDEIRSYFRSCGVITDIDCKMRPEDGAFSGIAFITFETEDAADRALALDRAAMGDRFLTIQQYVKTPFRRASGFKPAMVDGYNRVYVGNLAWDTTDSDIKELFSDCEVTSVRLGKNKETGEFKGYAHVDFKDCVSVAMALKLDQEIVRGRPVKISCAVPKKAGDTESMPHKANNDGPKKVETYAQTDHKKVETYAKTEPKKVETYAKTDSISEAATTEAVTNEADIVVVETAPVSSGKIRRRTCYECGEKGHLSSACPKKQQKADPTESNIS